MSLIDNNRTTIRHISFRIIVASTCFCYLNLSLKTPLSLFNLLDTSPPAIFHRAQPQHEQFVTYDTHIDIAMASQTYYTAGNRAYSESRNEDYSEHNFLKSLPDEHATNRQVVLWIDSGDKSRYTTSDPHWLSYCDFNGFAINNLGLNEMLDSLVRWGLQLGSAEWLAERVIFARGVSTCYSSRFQTFALTS